MSQSRKSLAVNKEIYESDWKFDDKALIEKQRRLEIILEKTTFDRTAQYLLDQVRFSQVLKYKGVLYELGVFIELWDITLKEPYVAKLVNIVQVPQEIEKLPFIEVEWCLKKKDLPKKILNSYGKHISSAQIFPSKIKYCLYVQSIKGKCHILSIEEYGQMSATYQNYFFTRSDYDDEKQQLNPSPKTWKSGCYCGAPENPDLQYVQCQTCLSWFHIECVKETNLDNTFCCTRCNNEKSSVSSI